MPTTEEIIKRLNLQPHPEGGYFKETFRSTQTIDLNGYNGSRNCATGIYFLLTAGNFSAFHRIKQDEMWHHYDGAPIEVHEIDKDGNYSCTIVGKDLEAGQVPQYVVKGGTWFASCVYNNGEYTLVGCTVAPGFDFADFELAERNELVREYPKHEKIINRLTRA